MKAALLIVMLIPCSLAAQSVRVTGVVRSDAMETLPLAHIAIWPDSITEVSDYKGNFEFRVKPGYKKISVSYTGYRIQQVKVWIRRDTLVNFSLQTSVDQLNEVVVSATRDRHQELFQSTQSSTHLLSKEDVSAIPVLGGEADLIKVLQLLPGTVRGIEGSSDLFVRGGAADQNLVLLDGATIYNTSHLFGFVSVFNPDILSSVESINGGFPANYGGRLSSVLNVNTNSEVGDKTHVAGDVGLIASRLYIEQPIVKDKVSVWTAGRRTYIDQVAKLANVNLPYFFYDFNAKLIARPSDRDHIEVAVYNGKDILDIFRDRNNDGEGFLTSYQSGNNSQSLKWTRQLRNGWYNNNTLTRTAYKYNIQNSFDENSLQAFSDIRDVSAKVEFGNVDFVKSTSLKLGADWTGHQISPSVINSTGTIAELLASSSTGGRIANELALFGLYEWKWNDRLVINTGMRTSMAVVSNKNYVIGEPRLSARYALSKNEAVKVSYSRMSQYLHRISYSAITSPTDIWYPVTDKIRPQTSHQFSLAWQRTFPQKNIFLSAETYYKPMNSLIGLEEGTNLFFNADFEPNLLQGKGKAYGLELLVRKNAGKFTGWISYTLSRSLRQYDALNEGAWFPSRYDRRHNGAIVGQYAWNSRWSVSMVWEFISGSRFTPIIGQYIVKSPASTGVDLFPVFAPINSVRLADTHRMDVGIKFRSKQGMKFRYEWFAGIYNVYKRANPVGINIETNEEDGSMRYQQPGLFGLLPFVSYGFKF